MKLLHIESSLFNDKGYSSQLSRSLVDVFRSHDPLLETEHLSFAEEPVPHFDAETIQALNSTNDARGAATYSDKQIERALSSDVWVIGLPMYNFGVPSMLKAWFDHIARAGTTFRYTSSGPEGLLKNKTVYLVASRGGIYQGTEKDTQTLFIQHFLNFLGIENVSFIYAEGLNMGDEQKEKALTLANQHIQSLSLT